MMFCNNLLPWRAQREWQFTQLFLIYSIFAMVLGLSLIISWHLFLKKQQQCLFATNKILNRELVNLQTKTMAINHAKSTYQFYQNEIQRWNKLQFQAPYFARIIAMLSRSSSSNRVLTQIEMNEIEVILTGEAHVSGDLSTFIKELQQSTLFTNVVLKDLKNTDSQVQIFKIVCKR